VCIEIFARGVKRQADFVRYDTFAASHFSETVEQHFWHVMMMHIDDQFGCSHSI
jgi:hypothetical protein